MNPLLYYHTVKYLKPVQIWNRVFRRLRRPVVREDLELCVRDCPGELVPSIVKPKSYVGQSTFFLLNTKGTVTCTEDWNSSDQSKLWLYNLHYADYLNQTGSDADMLDWVDRWIEGNAPGSGNGWDPYPISLRVVNWIKFHVTVCRLRPEHLNSLACQTDYLAQSLEYHLLANHLFANAKALFFAGVFFQGPQADSWRGKGRDILTAEIDEQILRDGGHFERSPMYHSIILEDVLDLLNLGRAFAPMLTENERKLMRTLQLKVPHMLAWLSCLVHPDGAIAFFNDATGDASPSSWQLVQYAVRLGIQEAPPRRRSFECLMDSGFARMGNSRFVCIVDIGGVSPSYQPGHAHSKALSVEVTVDKQRLLVNSGISGYQVGGQRLVQRGDAAHNAMTVDGQNSSEIWQSHRVARRARVDIVEREEDGAKRSIHARHDGFKRIKGVGCHHRVCALMRSAVVITDRLEGWGHHAVRLHWHFVPSISLRIDGNAVLIMRNDQLMGEFKTSQGWLAEVYPSQYHCGFGRSKPNWSIRTTWKGVLPCEATTEIVLKD